MCGFAACFDPDGRPVDPARLQQAAELLRHRGPDDEGFHLEPGLGMAFRRLAIVDLHSGHQPIANETNDLWIVFNGELYNHADLRRDLEARGHRYRTHSDTETMLHAYEEWGDDFLGRLRGMFAFAIWDRRRRRLIAARDHVGIKPLYWTEVGRGVVMASEIKALFALADLPRAADPDAIVQHVTLRYAAAPRTLFAGIHKLRPGHRLVVDANGVRETAWWQPEYEPKIEIDDDEALAEAERRLLDSVNAHLMSDVPLGALLSGGVDSSLVVAAMTRLMDRPVQTFSVGFEAEGSYSELPFARQVAELCHTDHREITVTAADLDRELPTLVWHQDEPMSEPAAIPTFLVSRLARETVTVVLTGEGGDELFAGYNKYFAEPWARTLAQLPAFARDPLLEHGIRRLPFAFRKLQVVGRSARFGDEAERWAAWFAGFVGSERDELLAPALRDHAVAGIAPFREALAATPARGSLDRMLDVDMRTWLPDDLLVKMDKMSMAASVEARVPLLDVPWIRWANRLPDRQKLRGLETKSLLKRLARRWLPAEIVDRPKVGFTVPLSPWFRGPMRHWLTDVLLSREALDRGYFRPAVVRGFVADHLDGRRDRARELWTLLTLELWHRAYLDRVPVRPTSWSPPPRVAVTTPA